MFTQTVALKDVKIHAFHGYYPEEQLIGCHFVLDVEVTFIPSTETENLDNTVNYEELNQIIINEMQQTQKLLETVVSNIIQKMVLKFPFLLSAKVGIKKLHPPMPGEIGHSFVQLNYTAQS